MSAPQGHIKVQSFCRCRSPVLPSPAPEGDHPHGLQGQIDSDTAFGPLLPCKGRGSIWDNQTW